jgi:hypothetical protein
MRLWRVAAGMTITHPQPSQTSRRYRHTAPGVQPAAAVTAVPNGRRTLAGYLLMPRPKDLFKALLMPLTFGLGVLANGGVSGQTLIRAAVVLAVLELLVYPARYQWNDIRVSSPTSVIPPRRIADVCPGRWRTRGSTSRPAAPSR